MSRAAAGESDPVLTGASRPVPLQDAVASGLQNGLQESLQNRLHGFCIFSWCVLGYNIAVILWGALVRATGSGAGCGGHWPLCNGQVVPTVAASVGQGGTWIEYTHRIMSGVALMAVAAMCVWAYKAFRAKSLVRKWATWSLVFILSEALIGAALVLLGHVAKNESVGRVYSLATHLINTFLLLASLALTAWWATPKWSQAQLSEDQGSSNPGNGAAGAEGRSRVIVGRLDGATGRRDGATQAAIFALVVVAIAGVITALGDTLFPSHTFAQGVADDFSDTANFLIRLRVIHPVLAIVTGGLVLFAAWPAFQARRSAPLHVLAGILMGLVVAQVFAGALTIALKAPLAMQLTHLFLADCLWISLILFAASSAALHTRAPITGEFRAK